MVKTNFEASINLIQLIQMYFRGEITSILITKPGTSLSYLVTIIFESVLSLTEVKAPCVHNEAVT